MSVAMEAVGDVATGAVLAHAVEPTTGSTASAGGHTTCLNCDTTLLGRYCHACGQSSHVHRTLMSIVHDLLHGVFHFEGKIWRTLPMLVLHPGALTRRYIAGERAKFVSPLALFLFTVFLMFATFSTLNTSTLGQGFVDGLTDTTVQVDQARADTAKLLATAVTERARAALRGRSTQKLDARIARLRADMAHLAAVHSGMDTARPGEIGVHSSFGWLDEGLQHAKQNPGLVLYKMQSAAYKYSWFLIFLSTPLVALLFLWRRRFGLYDHATFVTYSLGFMSLLVILLGVAGAIGTPSVLLALAALLAPPVHIFAQLRGAYGLGVFSALWRTTVLLGFALTALVMFMVGVVMLEVAP